MTKFKVGQTVAVHNPMRTYSRYDIMFRKHGFKNTVENPAFPINTQAVIKAIDVHELDNKRKLLILETVNGRQCVINQAGVRSLKQQEKIQTIIKEQSISFSKEQMFSLVDQYQQHLVQTKEEVKTFEQWFESTEWLR